MEYLLQRANIDEYYRQLNLTNDQFYFGLQNTIQVRQQEKIPIAGQSGYEFFTMLGDVMFSLGKATGIPLIAATGKGIRVVGEWTLGYNPDIQVKD